MKGEAGPGVAGRRWAAAQFHALSRDSSAPRRQRCQPRGGVRTEMVPVKPEDSGRGALCLLLVWIMEASGVERTRLADPESCASEPPKRPAPLGTSSSPERSSAEAACAKPGCGAGGQWAAGACTSPASALQEPGWESGASPAPPGRNRKQAGGQNPRPRGSIPGPTLIPRPEPRW